jgi:transcriptional regulator with XRE-family HTH domain
LSYKPERAKAPSESPSQELKTLGDHLRKRRLDLKLLQRQVALLLGVEEATIWNWENNRSSPKLHYIPRIVRFLGYVPFYGEPKTLGEKIINYRRLSGITRKELANRLGVDPGTLARWERNEGRPQKPSLGKINAFQLDENPQPARLLENRQIQKAT